MLPPKSERIDATMDCSNGLPGIIVTSSGPIKVELPPMSAKYANEKNTGEEQDLEAPFGVLGQQ
jgi:hypothetical protein